MGSSSTEQGAEPVDVAALRKRLRRGIRAREREYVAHLETFARAATRYLRRIEKGSISQRRERELVAEMEMLLQQLTWATAHLSAWRAAYISVSPHSVEVRMRYVGNWPVPMTAPLSVLLGQWEQREPLVRDEIERMRAREAAATAPLAPAPPSPSPVTRQSRPHSQRGQPETGRPLLRLLPPPPSTRAGAGSPARGA